MRLVFLTLSINSIQNLQSGEMLCFAYPYGIILSFYLERKMINHILGRMSLLNYWRMLGIQGNRQYTRMVWPFSFLKNKSFSLLRSPEISPFFYQSVLVSSWISARICQGVCSLKLQASTAAVQGVQACCTGKGHSFRVMVVLESGTCAHTLQFQASAPWH